MKNKLSLLLSLGTIGALLLGVAVLSPQFTSAGPSNQQQQAPLPTRVPSARPDEGDAVPVSQAIQTLSRNADLHEVLVAAQAGEVDDLLGLARPGAEPYCSSWGRYLPPECAHRDEILESVYFDSGEIVQRASESVRAWLVTFYQGKGADLEFASRDKRLPEGNGGKYYLFFRTDDPIKVDGELLADGLGVIITPGESKQIQSFVFFGPDDNGLEWIQRGPQGYDEARHHLLIAPASVADWKDLFGDRDR